MPLPTPVPVRSGSKAPPRTDARRRCGVVLAVVAYGMMSLARGVAAEPAGGDTLFAEARAILEARCFECHSHGGAIEGGLALDSRGGWAEGGDSGPAIVPGKPEESLLVKAIRYADAAFEMPPTGKLPAAEIAILERWVAAGAPDPRQGNTATRKKGVDIEAGRGHWAFQPVRDPPAPAVAAGDWPLDTVDRFVLARLEQEGLRPAADADRHAWLRRVSLDLTGLPPTPAEIAAFLADSSPQAHERVVDRLLASKAFGERWARHWLDLTGYADQMGTSNAVFAEHAWRYRDYLIAAFNADKPFDRFIREQIAGDLLPWATPEERAVNLTATGFLVLGDTEIVNVDKLKLDLDVVDQQVTKVGTAFLGMTLGCARCHDHKFDAIGLEDYYGLAGVFRSTSSVHKIPIGVWSRTNDVELPETERQIAARLVEEERHRQQLAGYKADRERLEKRKQEVAVLLKDAAKDAAEPVKTELEREEKELAEEVKKTAALIEHAEFFVPRPPRAFGVRDVEQPGDMRITVRGNPKALGPAVPRGVLRVASWSAPPPMPAMSSGRREVADWIADPRNPLTARVAVNRIWQKLFGEGIVRSVDYFGVRGEEPTHPELLDRLATDFVRGGWSQKRLIRRLTLSRAYRMSATADAAALARDPDNRLLSSMNRRRLDAEAIRDGVLAVSGRLVDADGGPALSLEMRENADNLTNKVNPPSFAFRRFRPEQEFERTIYMPIVRVGSQPASARLREIFDFTPPAQFSGKRPQTVVPTQALYLLNDPFLRARAADLARLATTAAADRRGRIEWLWLRVLSRPATSAEADEAGAFLDQLAPLVAESKQAEHDAWVELCLSLFESNEFLHEM
jgi:mono/diheme cytochrome c family protein